MAGNLGFTTLIVLFERELFVISTTTRYSSTTFIPLENMRLIHMSLTEKVVYTTNYASKPRIIVPKHPLWHLDEISFVSIKGNRILLFAKYYTSGQRALDYYLHLSIHEIRTDHRVGPALWSFNGGADGHFDIRDLKLIKPTENALGITFWARFDDHWKLFDLSTTETDTLNNFPLIESGRIDFDLKNKLRAPQHRSPGLSKFSCSGIESALIFCKSYYPLTCAFS